MDWLFIINMKYFKKGYTSAKKKDRKPIRNRKLYVGDEQRGQLIGLQVNNTRIFLLPINLFTLVI